jgi:Protein of unknown function (DUF1559)
MHNLALACANYESAHGRLPPAVVYGKDGQPLLSWRVLILPYLEERDLFNQFKLDEPWDSPHNLPLVEQMPQIYALPGSKSRVLEPGHTICHVFVGKGTAFEGPRGLVLKDVSDDASNTILIIEAGKPVPWTKPEELPFDPDRPLPHLYSPFTNVMRVAMVAGNVHYLPKSIDEQTLRALMTRNGNERLDWDVLERLK